MRLVQIAAAALLATLFAGAASAAVTHGTTGQQTGSPAGTGNNNSPDQTFQPQCYPTGITFVMKCTTPKPTSVSSESCSCGEVRARNAKGVLVWTSLCTKDVLPATARKVTKINCNSPRVIGR